MKNEWLQKMISLNDEDRSMLHSLMECKLDSVKTSTDVDGVVISVNNKNHNETWYLRVSDKLEFVTDPLEASILRYSDILAAQTSNSSQRSLEHDVFNQVDYIVNLIHWGVLSVAYKNKKLYSDMFPDVECPYDRFDVTVQAHYSGGGSNPMFGCIAIESEISEEEKEKWRKEHPLAQ